MLHKLSLLVEWSDETAFCCIATAPKLLLRSDNRSYRQQKRALARDPTASRGRR